MKILHISPSYKPAYIYGGPIVSVSRLCEAQVKLGHEVTVYTTTANGKNELLIKPNRPHIVDGVIVYYFTRRTKDHTHIAPLFFKYLWLNGHKFDIIHIHSWWNFFVMLAVLICRLKKITPVVSPRGMLSDYSFIHNNSILKKIIHKTFGKKLLKNTIFHATSISEQNELKNIVDNWRGFVAPNIVVLPKKKYLRSANEVFKIGFLGRIDAKKGLEVLFHSLTKVSFDFKLLIAGDGEPEYIKSLEKIASNIQMTKKIEWLGWLDQKSKYEFLSQIDLFVLTSHNENFANAVIEALAVGTPVLVSNKVGVYDTIQAMNWGWVVNLNPESITEGLNKVYESKNIQRNINENAPHQIYNFYSDINVANVYINSYSLATRN